MENWELAIWLFMAFTGGVNAGIFFCNSFVISAQKSAKTALEGWKDCLDKWDKQNQRLNEAVTGLISRFNPPTIQ